MGERQVRQRIIVGAMGEKQSKEKQEGERTKGKVKEALPRGTRARAVEKRVSQHFLFFFRYSCDLHASIPLLHLSQVHIRACA